MGCRIVKELVEGVYHIKKHILETSKNVQLFEDSFKILQSTFRVSETDPPTEFTNTQRLPNVKHFVKLPVDKSLSEKTAKRSALCQQFSLSPSLPLSLFNTLLPLAVLLQYPPSWWPHHIFATFFNTTMRCVVYQVDTVQDQQMLHRQTERESERERHSWLKRNANKLRTSVNSWISH